MIRTPLLLQWSPVNTNDTHPFIVAVISCKHKWYAPLYYCSDLLKTQMIRTPLLLQWSLVNTHDTHPFITAVISCKHKWYAPLYLMLETFTYVSDLNMWPYAVCTCGLCIIFTYVSDLNIWPNISLYVWPMWYIDICVWSVHLAICDLHTLPMWYNHICVWSVYVVMI
jgi:hypothetical protein